MNSIIRNVVISALTVELEKISRVQEILPTDSFTSVWETGNLVFLALGHVEHGDYGYASNCLLDAKDVSFDPELAKRLTSYVDAVFSLIG